MRGDELVARRVEFSCEDQAFDFFKRLFRAEAVHSPWIDLGDDQ